VVNTGHFKQTQNMETIIEQDLAGVYPERKEPKNYAYKYGQLRGLIITLKHLDKTPSAYLRERVNAVINRMEEIDRE